VRHTDTGFGMSGPTDLLKVKGLRFISRNVIGNYISQKNY